MPNRNGSRGFTLVEVVVALAIVWFFRKKGYIGSRRDIEERTGKDQTTFIDAHDTALRLFGDSIAGNMLLVGIAYQQGLIPIAAAAIEKAISLNGAQVTMNLDAFRTGRLWAHDAAAIDGLAHTPAADALAEPTLVQLVEQRSIRLTAFQNAAWAERYAKRIIRLAAIETAKAPGKSGLAESAARGLFKLMSYKDEYEVARLYTDGSFARQVAQQFEGDYTLNFHLAPPIIGRTDPASGKPVKSVFGPWMMMAFRVLAGLKGLRGTWADIFGRTAERRAERAAITDYEHLLDEIETRLGPANHALAVELAGLPETVRGFGHVKAGNAAKATARREVLLERLRGAAPLAPERLAAE